MFNQTTAVEQSRPESVDLYKAKVRMESHCETLTDAGGVWR